MISLILLVVAFVLFLISATNKIQTTWNLIALGLAFWVLAQLLGGAHILH